MSSVCAPSNTGLFFGNHRSMPRMHSRCMLRALMSFWPSTRGLRKREANGFEVPASLSTTLGLNSGFCVISSCVEAKSSSEKHVTASGTSSWSKNCSVGHHGYVPSLKPPWKAMTKSGGEYSLLLRNSSYAPLKLKQMAIRGFGRRSSAWNLCASESGVADAPLSGPIVIIISIVPARSECMIDCSNSINSPSHGASAPMM
ncbi:unnamed protein product [Prorocentrum cordatum]|uniref:Subtilisin n=1 Tax=Prorocentrum cordatum TaxID=2364126 RepID=A0ABN9V4D9_9DINO|nr:unnamed protein product [Polarella glacialis]